VLISTRGNTHGKRDSTAAETFINTKKSRCFPTNEALPLCRTGNYSDNVIAYRYLRIRLCAIRARVRGSLAQKCRASDMLPATPLLPPLPGGFNLDKQAKRRRLSCTPAILRVARLDGAQVASIIDHRLLWFAISSSGLIILLTCHVSQKLPLSSYPSYRFRNVSE